MRRPERFPTNGGESSINFTPHPLTSYHMEHQDHNALQCIRMSKWFIDFNTLHESMDKKYTVFYIDKLIRRNRVRMYMWPRQGSHSGNC